MKLKKKTILIILLITLLTVFIQNEKTMFDFFWILIHDFGIKTDFCSQMITLIHGGWPFAFMKFGGSSGCSKDLYFNILGFLIDFSVLFSIYILSKQIFNKITHHKSAE